MFIHLSLHERMVGNRDAQSHNEIKLTTITKFLEKCCYGGHPWIRLAMDCERIGGMEMNFTFCLGTTYDVSSMEDNGNSRSFSLTGKACLPKYFTSLI